MTTIAKIIEDTKSYYDAKLAQHDATPAGVDWNGQESQELRFKQLLSLCDTQVPFILNDLGCGYGALYDYLSGQGLRFHYRGVDISQAMIEKAWQRFKGRENCLFTTQARLEPADYTVASGIFNVKQTCDDSDWFSYVLSTLDAMAEASKKAFAFNCLTSYSDQEYMRNYLYYADPCFFFDYCKKHYSRNVALLHDYNLYEFTLIVRKVL